MKRSKGFTLVELMIVVAIIAILTTIAYPSYQEYVRRNARAQAKTDLLEITHILERRFTTDRDYTTAGLPYAESPRSGTKRYDLEWDDGEPTKTTYKLKATPTGPQADDKCGVLTIDQRGVKTNDGTADLAECWPG